MKISSLIKKIFTRSPHNEPVLKMDKVKMMVKNIACTNEEELDCNACFQELDRFAEMQLANKSVSEAMPLVADHLSKCKDCREEYEALLKALKMLKK